MTDEQFLTYCDNHSYTERNGHVPATIIRLFKLAGPFIYAADIAHWEKQPNVVHEMDFLGTQQLVAIARARIAAEKAEKNALRPTLDAAGLRRELVIELSRHHPDGDVILELFDQLGRIKVKA